MNTEFEKTAVIVPKISMIGNGALFIIKMLAGLAAHSGAMVSDAVHSATDVFSDIIVMLGVKLSLKAPDDEHPYGHERFESAAAVVLSVILCITGLFIGYAAVGEIRGKSGGELQTPGIPALIAATVSIAVKEALFRYTRFYAKRLNSGALMAEAWHHRSDALASLGALVGIWGARKGFAWLDPAASLLICCFILRAAGSIFSDAIRKMIDHACSAEMKNAIADCAVSQPGVKCVKNLRTREFGNKIYVDIEICADRELTLSESSAIAERVHCETEKRFEKIKHITVKVSPD